MIAGIGADGGSIIKNFESIFKNFGSIIKNLRIIFINTLTLI